MNRQLRMAVCPAGPRPPAPERTELCRTSTNTQTQTRNDKHSNTNTARTLGASDCHGQRLQYVDKALNCERHFSHFIVIAVSKQNFMTTTPILTSTIHINMFYKDTFTAHNHSPQPQHTTITHNHNHSTQPHDPQTSQKPQGSRPWQHVPHHAMKTND